MPRNNSSRRRERRKIRAKVTPSAVRRKRLDVDYLRKELSPDGKR